MRGKQRTLTRIHPKTTYSDVDGHSSKGSEEFEKEAQSPISKKEEPKEVDRRMTPHKRHTPKNVVERALC